MFACTHLPFSIEKGHHSGARVKLFVWIAVYLLSSVSKPRRRIDSTTLCLMTSLTLLY
jgi:hypothetical protein